MRSFDVIVIGGGMVGLSLACGLKNSGLRIAVLESQPIAEPNDRRSLRVSAINPASEQLFRYLGVWNDIVSDRASPYRSMEVWERDSFAGIEFNAAEYGYEHLGHIVENLQIQKALWQQAQSCSDIQLFTDVQPKQIAWGEAEAFLTLQDERVLSAKLVIGADGANSWLRRQADIPVTFRDYNHHALVANIRTAEPHDACARQIFCGDSLLAFLPLSDPHLCSIVWSLPPERAEYLHSVDELSFNRALSVEFDNRLGLCELQSERRCFPLTARYARNFASQRMALIGDAAHTIHPLAGQGVNLGLMDAIVLIGELKRLLKQGKDIGSYRYLRQYERQRKYSAAQMLAAMQGLQDLFAGDNPAKKLFRDIGLSLADKIPGVKPLLVRKATGLDELPDWLNNRII